MTGLAALHVLAEPRRVAILELLREGERPVGDHSLRQFQGAVQGLSLTHDPVD